MPLYEKLGLVTAISLAAACGSEVAIGRGADVSGDGGGGGGPRADSSPFSDASGDNAALGAAATLASGFTSLRGIAVDGDGIFVADSPALSPGAPPAGRVVRIPLTGGAPVTLASEQDEPTGVVSDPTTVYWTNAGHYESTAYVPGSVAKAAKSGGGAVTVAGGQINPIGIGVDAANVYWTNNGRGPSDPEPSKLGLWQTSLAGGPTRRLSPAPGGAGWTLAVTSSAIYYNSTASVFRVALGGSSTVLHTTSDASVPWWTAVDDNAVYWTTANSGDVKSVPLDGGPATRLYNGSGGSTRALVTDGASIYFVSVPSGSSTSSIVRIPRTGGPPTVLVKGEAQISAIAVDKTHVYWTTATAVQSTTK